MLSDPEYAYSRNLKNEPYQESSLKDNNNYLNIHAATIDSGGTQQIRYNPADDFLTSGAHPDFAHRTMSLSPKSEEKRNSQYQGHHRNFSHTDLKSGKSNRSGCISPASDGVTSNKSKRSVRSGNSRKSGMTRNPLHFEEKVMRHVVPGIDDRESHIYREYDHKGRMAQSFYQRAALAGIKNLETNCFRKDSPIR